MKLQGRGESIRHRARGATAARFGRRNLPAMSGRNSPADERPPSAIGLFTRGTFRALAAPDGGSYEWTRALRPVIAVAPGATLAEAFDLGLSQISRKCRPEYVFKNKIVDRLIFGRHSPRTAAAVLELHAGRSIVDVAVFNGTSTAYEIKTDLDDFSRLLPQIRCYERCFERVVVVTSPRLAPRVVAAVPDHVGVVALTDRGSLSEVRAPASGLARVSQTGLFGTDQSGLQARISNSLMKVVSRQARPRR